MLQFESACEYLNGRSNYTVLRGIGRGSYATVFLAKDNRSQTHVALKIIHTHILRSREDARRVLREASLMEHFRHDNLCPLLDLFFFEAEPASASASSSSSSATPSPPTPSNKQPKTPTRRLCIVMPFLQTDLQHVVSAVRQEVTENHIRWWLYQALLGLLALHCGGVIHRDLTPGNILLSLTCDLRIADFGLARSRPRSRDLRAHPLTDYVVTRYYRAPELLLGKRDYTAAVDVWSLGCIAVELYARAVLFRGAATLHQMALILDVMCPRAQPAATISGIPAAADFVLERAGGPPVPLEMLMPGASASMVSLVSTMLAFDPADRITVVNALQHDALADFYLESDVAQCAATPRFCADEEGLHSAGDVVERIEALCTSVAAARRSPTNMNTRDTATAASSVPLVEAAASKARRSARTLGNSGDKPASSTPPPTAMFKATDHSSHPGGAAAAVAAMASGHGEVSSVAHDAAAALARGTPGGTPLPYGAAKVQGLGPLAESATVRRSGTMSGGDSTCVRVPTNAPLAEGEVVSLAHNHLPRHPPEYMRDRMMSKGGNVDKRVQLDERSSRASDGSAPATVRCAPVDSIPSSQRTSRRSSRDSLASLAGGPMGTSQLMRPRGFRVETVSRRSSVATTATTLTTTSSQPPGGSTVPSSSSFSSADWTVQDLDDDAPSCGPPPSPGYMRRVWARLPGEEVKRGLHPRMPAAAVAEMLRDPSGDLREVLYKAIETTSAGLLLSIVKDPRWPSLAGDTTTMVAALRRCAYLCCADLVRIMVKAAPHIPRADTGAEYCERELLLPSQASSSSRGPALHTAAAKCSVGAVHVLCEAGASIDSLSHQGMTATHQAIRGRALWSLVYLLQRGARTDIPDRQGITATQAAAESRIAVLELAVQRVVTGHNGLSRPV
eukprot:TRINITY_DN2977_c0_g1_i1.p1 TRINITY_DN2977_c0_g1~~TRINITY_DN2977_c0_g1_i1.p1  ORF type:complete len:904 (-),score=134.41 TRINITY_DN2977_c0_g1_i1:1687-4398(-)